ncbi:MAG: sulfotransferase family 2 domain-containing protein [Akkermansiaceae bacterium]|nr:sulfotransferase family 2 domain-containing protein [Verrucomicrobiales bacterium]
MIVFLHVPKTAGTSFRFILENSFGYRHCHAGHNRKSVFLNADLQFAQRFFPGMKSIAGHNLVNPLRIDFPEPHFITFLREPISRVISHYQDSVVRGNNRKSFEACLQENAGLENLHVKLIAGERNLDKAKRFLEGCHGVGLTEKFDLSLHLLQRLVPQRLNLQYRRRLVARDNAIRKTIEQDSRLLELAREYNQLDLDLYQFAVNELFPALCDKAGLRADQQVESLGVKSRVASLKFTLGRLYNKFYRQACKSVGQTGVPETSPGYCDVPARS